VGDLAQVELDRVGHEAGVDLLERLQVLRDLARLLGLLLGVQHLVQAGLLVVDRRQDIGAVPAARPGAAQALRELFHFVRDDPAEIPQMLVHHPAASLRGSVARGALPLQYP